MYWGVIWLTFILKLEWILYPVYKIINSLCPLILLILVWKQAKYHQVMKYHEGRFAADQIFGRPQTVHGQLEK